MGCGSSAPRPAEAADAATREGLVARGFELGQLLGFYERMSAAGRLNEKTKTWEARIKEFHVVFARGYFSRE